MTNPARSSALPPRISIAGRAVPERLWVHAVALLFTPASLAFARQGEPDPAASANGAAPDISIWQLFAQSFDFFTVLLVIASIAAWAIIVMTAIEVRESNLLPAESEEALRKLAGAGAWSELRAFAEQDSTFISRVVLAGLDAPGDDKEAVREAAELEASEQCARCFRRIEPLNVIGNLGPLLGLAGTVWGMVIAFAALGQAGGQASPANLSTGISKALFHTLLGLLLALPALAVFGFYRARIDRICNRAMITAAGIVELLPGGASARRPKGEPQKAAAPQNSR